MNKSNEKFDGTVPLGLLPRNIHRWSRINDISDAIGKYLQCQKEIPIEWIVEYNELITIERQDKSIRENEM